MNRVTHINESRHIGARVFGDGGGETAPDNLHVTYEDVMSHMSALCHTYE